MQDENESIAAKVRGLAAERRMTQEQIATVLGLSRKAVGARYNGSVPFTGPEMRKLSRVFGVDIADLFAEERAS